MFEHDFMNEANERRILPSSRSIEQRAMSAALSMTHDDPEWAAEKIVAEFADLEPPSDDDEPVTEEWLESIGVADIDINAAWVRRCAEFEYGVCGKWTRGEIRRLCSALGIDLKRTEGR